MVEGISAQVGVQDSSDIYMNAIPMDSDCRTGHILDQHNIPTCEDSILAHQHTSPGNPPDCHHPIAGGHHHGVGLSMPCQFHYKKHVQLNCMPYSKDLTDCHFALPRVFFSGIIISV